MNQKLILICTGLGHQRRGFEQYIAALADRLNASGQFPEMEVWSGGDWDHGSVRSRTFPLIRRTNRLIRSRPQAFLLEQFSFFLAIIPALCSLGSGALYLGEFRLYCWIFKLRQALKLKFSLCLYTGGQAIPGTSVFDSRRDMVHHVSPVYLADCRHVPADRQCVLPHFLTEDFAYAAPTQQRIREKAGQRAIVLSVGLLDTSVKRMHLLIEALGQLGRPVFPILLGERSTDTPLLEQMLQEKFGPGEYLMETLPHQALGDFYQVADLFVLCSPRESFGLAMAEALYHGLPVLCHDFAEARLVFGDSLHYTNATDTTRLSADIQALLQVGRTLPHATPDFRWSTLGPTYIQMFKTILS